MSPSSLVPTSPAPRFAASPRKSPSAVARSSESHRGPVRGTEPGDIEGQKPRGRPSAGPWGRGGAVPSEAVQPTGDERHGDGDGGPALPPGHGNGRAWGHSEGRRHPSPQCRNGDGDEPPQGRIGAVSPRPPPHCRTYPMQECLRDGQRPSGCIPGPAVSLCPASPMVRGHKAALWLLLPCGSIGGLFPLRCSSATPGTAPTRARCHRDVEQTHTYPPQWQWGTPGWGQCGRAGGDAAGTAALVPNSEILSMLGGVKQRRGGAGGRYK